MVTLYYLIQRLISTFSFFGVLRVWSLVLGIEFVHAENLGTFSFENLVLEPQFSLREASWIDRNTTHGRRSGFELNQALLGVKWEKDSVISGHLALGSLRNLNRPTDYGLPLTTYGIYEGFAEHRSGYGILRAGLIPLMFGSEGRRYESELDFPRSLFFQTRQLSLRDFGVSYGIMNNSYYTQLAAHNGEVGEEADNRTYLTAGWGWFGRKGVHMGLSAQSGRPVNQVSLVETRLRMGNFFAGMRSRGTGIEGEVFYGDRSVFETKTTLLSWHVDAFQRISEQMSFQLRYDELDPSREVAGDLVREWSLGFVVRDQLDLQRFYILGVRRLEENTTRADDEIMISWRLMSFKPSSDDAPARY